MAERQNNYALRIPLLPWDRSVLLNFALVISIALLNATYGFAQNDPEFSQYMFNKFAYNPGYAGSDGGLSVNAEYRAQWTKVDGAPTDILLDAQNISKNEKYGYGGQIFRDAIGPISQYGFYGTYAYRFHFRGNTLAWGLQAGLSYINTNWAELTAYQQGDAAYPGNQTSTISPNFGTGLYFEGKNLTAGFSAPHLINNSIDKKAEGYIDNTYYLTLDYKIKIKGDKFRLVPATLLKFTGTQTQLNLNLYLVIIRSIWIGIGYRTDNSANFTFQYEFKKDRNRFRVGYAYDLSNGGYRTVTGGSHEVILTYVLEKAPFRLPALQNMPAK